MGKDNLDYYSYALNNVEFHPPRRKVVKDEDYYWEHQTEEGYCLGEEERDEYTSDNR